MARKTRNRINKATTLNLSFKEINRFGCQILERKGTPLGIAQQVVYDLVKNEINGHGSHGLLRLREYTELIEQGHIVPHSQPIANNKNKFLTEIDGQKCFGILASHYVCEALKSHLLKNKFGIVTLTNSGHIGRLRTTVLPACMEGGIVIGFCNLSGAGQNVLPFGGNAGRLCTNPIVIGVPSKPPIIIDMSTSIVSEGKIRKMWLEGKKVPKGWLFDQQWRSVFDPEKFYENSKTAFLGPLGGKEFGYKGFGLALMTEIFAGILTGGGFSQALISKINNNALFLSFHLDLLGQSLEEFQTSVEALVEYLRSSSLNDELHIPGWETHSEQENLDQERTISIDAKLFEKLQCLANL